MKPTGQHTFPLRVFAAVSSLGGEVLRYREKQEIYAQGELAETLFYIQKGGVRLSSRRNHRPAAVTALLGAGDFFGELCLADFPIRMSTAVTLTACSIRTIKKAKMLQLLRAKNKISICLLAHLLSDIKNYRDHVAELLTSPAKQRLAHVLLRLAHLGKKGRTGVNIPHQTDLALAGMVGTTRSRINVFMNEFKKRGFIGSKNGIEVRPSLRKALGAR